MQDRGWQRFWGSALARGISLLGALALMLLITLNPRPLTTGDGQPVSHGVLMLVMWGMVAGFVHGVGFTPHGRLLRFVLGACTAWPLLGLGLLFYLSNGLSA